MNGERRREELDFLLEVREQAHLWNEKYKALIAREANKKMKTRSFPEGTLILHQGHGPHRASEDKRLTPD